jgi:hypothetical protein
VPIARSEGHCDALPGNAARFAQPSLYASPRGGSAHFVIWLLHKSRQILDYSPRPSNSQRTGIKPRCEQQGRGKMRDSDYVLPPSNHGLTRRGVLRRFLSAGLFTTAGVGLTQLITPASSRAATSELPRLPSTMVLNALPSDAPAGLREAIEAGCCITYTLDEHHCGNSSCPSGECCYHIQSTDCGLDYVTCLAVSCAEGDFSTGC